MEYVVDGHHFTISYQELREKYHNFCDMTDEDFKKNIVAALHLACVISFFKEIPTYLCLSDRGIIHELVHELHIGDGNTTTFAEIRELFKQHLKLD